MRPGAGALHPRSPSSSSAISSVRFCARVAPVLKQLLQDYGDDVALLFRHHPLAMHPQAMLAAQASEAAREQGKFWEMHDRLFADQDNLDRAGLERAAREIGLDMAAFQRSMHKDAGLDRIQRDQTEAARFGAVGTPTFFINGREFRGAQPIEGFKRAIDDEIKNADAKLAAGTPRARLYAALIDRGLDKAPPAPPSPNQPDTTRRYRAEIQGAPVQGAKDALVTIVEWADFECPFCARSEKTLAAILKEYKGRVRRVWRDLPLRVPHPRAVGRGRRTRGGRAGEVLGDARQAHG